VVSGQWSVVSGQSFKFSVFSFQFSAFQLFSFSAFSEYLREQVAGQDAVEAAMQGLRGFEAAFEFGLLGFGEREVALSGGGGRESRRGVSREGSLDLMACGLQFFADSREESFPQDDAKAGLCLVEIPAVARDPDLADGAEFGELADDDAGAGLADGELRRDLLKSDGSGGEIKESIEPPDDPPEAKGMGGVPACLNETTTLLQPRARGSGFG